VAVLRGLLGAAGVGDHPDALHISPAGRRSDYGHETDKESAYSQTCPRDGGAGNRGRNGGSAAPYRLGPNGARRFLNDIQRSPHAEARRAAPGICPTRTLVPPSPSPSSSSAFVCGRPARQACLP
jgi:hypothetical protein